MAFDYPQFMRDVDASKKGTYRSVQSFMVNVSTQVGTPQQPIVYPLPSPVQSIVLMPVIATESGQVVFGSSTAVIAVRINGQNNAWFPVSFGLNDGGQPMGACEIHGPIWSLEYFIAAVDSGGYVFDEEPTEDGSPSAADVNPQTGQVEFSDQIGLSGTVDYSDAVAANPGGNAYLVGVMLTGIGLAMGGAVVGSGGDYQ